MQRFASLVLGLLLPLLAVPAHAQGPFSNWAAVVVAGDWHAHSGGPTEAFDNARRDIGLTLAGLGFAPDAIRQYSVRPKRYPAVRPSKTDLRAIHDDLRDLATKNTAGCLVYLTSHGAPEGAVLDDDILPPSLLAAVVDDACPARPSIVVVSACFSGVFVKPLQREDRMILTAARSDRTSFGCSEDDKYPYFDDCFLSSAPTARDFAALGRAVQGCVARRERDTGAEPASEPQLWIGAGLRPLLPLYAFPRPPPRGSAKPAAATLSRGAER
ncbi:peptidase C13 [Caulobacter sp. Root1455]|uniref:C13 family peptidase n=1 Tax=Caulobacter sp. Root1455 TaxID=1736465 RepID=UPI0006F5D27A|nr:C13 family peptidase [Caulobacter sp. Root1455]KQY92671.1 peptidase C13 [Caulobacter sp. Root1455]